MKKGQTMKRLRLDGPPNVRLQEGGETYTPGQELEVSNGRAKELRAVKRLYLSVVEETTETKPVDDGSVVEKTTTTKPVDDRKEEGGLDGTV